MSEIGLIISGMPKVPSKGISGFNNDIVTINHVDEVKKMLIDERATCNFAKVNFFSIEKTANYILYTIYNPNTFDHVSREAYIGITLFLTKNKTIKGSITEKLNELMNIYISNENNINENLFSDQISTYSTESLQAYIPNGEKLGYKKYNSISEINTIFNNIQLKNFKKIYFFNNNDQIEKNKNYFDYDLEQQYSITISGIDPNHNRIFLNNKQLKIEWSDRQLSIPAFNDDKITVYDESKLIKEIVASGSINYVIPTRIIEPPKQFKEPEKWYKKYAPHISIGTLLIAAVVVGMSFFGDGESNEHKSKKHKKHKQDFKYLELTDNQKKIDSLYNPNLGIWIEKNPENEKPWKAFYFREKGKWYGVKLDKDSNRLEKKIRDLKSSINDLNQYFKDFISEDIDKLYNPDEGIKLDTNSKIYFRKNSSWYTTEIKIEVDSTDEKNKKKTELKIDVKIEEKKLINDLNKKFLDLIKKDDEKEKPVENKIKHQNEKEQNKNVDKNKKGKKDTKKITIKDPNGKVEENSKKDQESLKQKAKPVKKQEEDEKEDEKETRPIKSCKEMCEEALDNINDSDRDKIKSRALIKQIENQNCDCEEATDGGVTEEDIKDLKKLIK